MNCFFKSDEFCIKNDAFRKAADGTAFPRLVEGRRGGGVVAALARSHGRPPAALRHGRAAAAAG